MNYREKIKKAIECPQLNNTRYGEWGALTLEQRKYIKRLLDELDSADKYIEKLYLKNKQLQERIEYLERSNNRREDTILEQRQEISDLEDNWNDLKKYAKEVISTDNELYGTDLLDKIQELEQGSDSNE